MRRCLKFRGISSIIPRLPLRCHSHSPRAPLEASQGRLGAPSGRLGASWGDLVKILDALEAPKTTVRTYIGLFSRKRITSNPLQGPTDAKEDGRGRAPKPGPRPGPKPGPKPEPKPGQSHAEETGAWNHSALGSGKETPQEAWSFVRSVFVSPAFTEIIFACTEKGATINQSSWPPKSWLNDHGCCSPSASLMFSEILLFG